MSRLDLPSIASQLRDARHSIIMAWTPELDSEAAPHLLNALLDVELAIVGLEADGDEPKPSEIREMASALVASGGPQ